MERTFILEIVYTDGDLEQAEVPLNSLDECRLWSWDAQVDARDRIKAIRAICVQTGECTDLEMAP